MRTEVIVMTPSLVAQSNLEVVPAFQETGGTHPEYIACNALQFTHEAPAA